MGKKRSRRKYLSGLILIAISITGVLLALFLLMNKPTTGYYQGPFSHNIFNYYSNEVNEDTKSKILNILYHYWEDILGYNISYTIIIKPGKTVDYSITVHGSEDIRVRIASNGSVLYQLYSSNGKLLYYETLDRNATISINPSAGIINGYIRFFTNSSRPVKAHIMISKDVRDPGSFLKAYKEVWVALVALNYVLTHYNITYGYLEEISSSRSPSEIIGSNTTSINIFEAVGIMNLFFQAYGVDTRIGVVDVDGDGEGDYCILLFNYHGDGSQYLNELRALIKDLNREDILSEIEKASAKHVVFEGKTWILIDPKYTINPYVPGYMDLPEKYRLLGVIAAS